MLYLYHEAQSTYNVLGDEIFPLKLFYQPLMCEYQTGSEQNTDKFQTQKVF